MTSYGQMTNPPYPSYTARRSLSPLQLVHKTPPGNWKPSVSGKSCHRQIQLDLADFSPERTHRSASDDAPVMVDCDLTFVMWHLAFLLFRMCIPPIAVQSGSLHRQWGNVLWQFYFYKKKGNFVPFLIRGSLWDYGWNLWAEFYRYLCRFLRCFYAY